MENNKFLFKIMSIINFIKMLFYNIINKTLNITEIKTHIIIIKNIK